MDNEAESSRQLGCLQADILIDAGARQRGGQPNDDRSVYVLQHLIIISGSLR